MDASVLAKLFGREQRWHGPCTVILDAEAAMLALGLDSILGGGAKQYAPRMVSGRLVADTACLLQDGSALVVVQQQKVRQQTGEEATRQTLTVADPGHIVAIEFPDSAALAGLGLTAPIGLRPIPGSHSGQHVRPA